MLTNIITETINYYENTITHFINNETQQKLFILVNKDDVKTVIEIAKKHNIYCQKVVLTPSIYLSFDKTVQTTITNEYINKHFIHDFKLPIPIYKEPYFSYFMDLYNEEYDTHYKYKLLQQTVEYAKTHNMTFEYYFNQVKNNIINSIVNSKLYPKFQKYAEELTAEIPQPVNIYNNHNKKYYISIDITEANFMVFRHFNPGLVQNCNCWAEFIANFTPCEYFLKAKYFRQLVIGSIKLDVRNLQKKLLSNVYVILKKYSNIKIVGIIGSDELIIESSENTLIDDIINLKKINIFKVKEFMYHIEGFSIEPMDPYVGYLRKTVNINTKEFKTQFKCVNKDLHAQVFKKYHNLPPHPYDLKTVKDSMVITYDEPFF
jgi:hypothetical protein